MDGFLQFWEERLEVGRDEEQELDPGASEAELVDILEDRYRQTVLRIKEEYQNQRALQEYSSETVRECLRELDRELEQPAEGVAGLKAEIFQENQLISSLVKEIGDMDKENQRVENMAQRVRAYTESKGETGKGAEKGPRKGSEPALEEGLGRAALANLIVDQEEVRRALAEYTEEGMAALVDLSRALIHSYQSLRLPEPDPEVAAYYQARLQQPRKKRPAFLEPVVDLKRVFNPQEYQGKKVRAMLGASLGDMAGRLQAGEKLDD